MLQPMALAFLGCALLSVQTANPEREVTANVLGSARNPRVRIHLPKPAHYLGADRWVLYDMADCELHAFVESDHHHHVRKLTGQFEGYLPSRPELKHTYDSPKGASLGGMDFYVESWTGKASAEMRAGSEIEHITRG